MKIHPVRAALAAAIAIALAGPAAAEDDPGLVELVQILKKEGVLDDDQYAQIVTRADAREKSLGWWDRIHISGDLRLRYENFFFFNKNEDGVQQDERHRGRYRVRFNVGADVNDHFSTFFQLTTGDDPRSSNQTIGSTPDFGPDVITFRQAYIQYTPFAKGEIPGHAGWLGARGGKVPNSFTWKKTPDYLLFDGDIKPEGLDVIYRANLNEDLEVYSNGGIFVLDENSSDRDVTMGATQIGGHWQATENLKVGSRFAWFGFFDPDAAFVTRNADLGNIPGGFDAGDSSFHVVAGTAYLTLDCFEDWPITLYGVGASNLSAQSALGAGKQNLAWQVGLQGGDKKKFLQAGFLYAQLHANAFPAVLVDSDLFDGFTNRKGWAIFAKRQIMKNTDLKLTIFKSKRISKTADPLGVSVPNANRLRMQADVVVAF